MKMIFSHSEANALVHKFANEANMPVLVQYQATRHAEFVWYLTTDINGLRFVLCQDGTLHMTGMEESPFSDGNNVCKVTHEGNILIGYLNWLARNAH
jgi:hypothetical protein